VQNRLGKWGKTGDINERRVDDVWTIRHPAFFKVLLF
jgi:hypothetical protein